MATIDDRYVEIPALLDEGFGRGNCGFDTLDAVFALLLHVD
jgi:hypothetical protein